MNLTETLTRKNKISLNSVIPVLTGSSVPTHALKKTQEEVGLERKRGATESVT